MKKFFKNVFALTLVVALVAPMAISCLGSIGSFHNKVMGINQNPYSRVPVAGSYEDFD